MRVFASCFSFLVLQAPNRHRRMRNRMYGGVRGRRTKVGEKLLRFPPTRFMLPAAAVCLGKGRRGRCNTATNRTGNNGGELKRTERMEEEGGEQRGRERNRR